MADLIIEGKKLGKTPSVEFKTNGEFKIYGRSIPEDSRIFYDPIFNWLEILLPNFPSKVELKITLEYYNSSSSVQLLKLFEYLVHVNRTKHTVVNIIWFYSVYDDEMLEAGKDYLSIVKLPFEFVSVID